jgi:pimeloyl-ACP methyl ester carboxylesterase
MRLVQIFIASVLFAFPAMAQDLKGVGVVLIHGKAGGQGPLQPLANALKKEGAIVLMPRMSWTSGYRPYGQVVQEVASAVARIRQMGARKVYLAGHSLGANISFGYGAAGGDVDGTIAMAPGHRPDFIETVAGDSLERAKAMVAAGRGSEKAKFVDFNQGRALPITTTAEAYVSFFDPSGPAGSAARGRGASGSVLWVIGNTDRPAMRDPATSSGTRVEVNADHRSTPIAGVPFIIDWLKKR